MTRTRPTPYGDRTTPGSIAAGTEPSTLRGVQLSDEFRLPVNGEFAVYASDDAGDRWFRAGDWSRPGFDGVLRDAMAIDGNGGVYVGSTAGRVALSADTGETWLELDVTFPRIVSLHAFVI